LRCAVYGGRHLGFGATFLGGEAESAFQETSLAAGATAFFALAALMMVSVGVSYLGNIAKLLKALDERDLNFKEWQLKVWQVQQASASHAQNIQFPPGGQLGS
jgi:hypothetical protein